MHIDKLIIAGSRDIFTVYTLLDAMKIQPFSFTEVVSGGARGVDTLGENFAKDHKLKLTRFPANWDKHGKSAGYIRNSEMATYADALLAIWDGKSKGTKNMISVMLKLGKPVYVYIPSTKEGTFYHTPKSL